MPDSSLPVNPATGGTLAPIDIRTVTTGAGTVDRQVTVIGDPTIGANELLVSGTGTIGVTTTDGAQATIGAQADAVYTTGTGSVVSILKGIFAKVAGTLTATITGALPAGANAIGSVFVSNLPGTQPVSGTVSVSNFPATQPVSGTVATVGSVASSSPDSGNPVKVGGKYNATTTALTTSGNEVNDALRALGVQGDGLSNDSSFGIWPAATNLLLNGGFESGVTNHIPVNATLVQSAAQFKFGSKSGLLTATAGAGNHYDVASSAAITNATVYTASIVAKYSNNQWIEVGYDRGAGFHLAYFDILNGAVGVTHGTISSASIVALPGGWYRCIVTFTTDGTNGGVSIYLASANGTDSYTALGTEAVYIDGIQLETGSVATPYIETNGATATRAAARVQAPASLLSTTQGLVVIRARLNFPSTNTSSPTLFEWAATTNDLIQLYWNGTQWTASWVVAGAATNAVSAQTFAVGAVQTIVMAWTATQIMISVNGAPFAAVAISGTPAIPAGTLLDFGNAQNIFAGREAMSNFFWVATGTGTLSNTDVAAAYLQSNNDPTLFSFPETANVTAVMPFNTAAYNVPTRVSLVTAPVLIDGYRSDLQIDQYGNTKVINAGKQAGEDFVNDVLKVREVMSYVHIATATTTVVKSGAGYLRSLTINQAAAGTISIYDNTAGSGTLIAVLKASNTEQTFSYHVAFSTGLTIVTAAASDLTVSYA